MKKHLLMKTLLVALVCLVGGTSSVWADKTYMTTMTGQLGLSDNSTPAWTYYTKTATIKAGETYTYTFQNYTKGSSAGGEWETWIAEIRENTSGYCLDARGDGGGWTWDGDPSTGTLVYNYTGKAWDEGGRSLADFMTAYNDVTVTLTISCSNDGKVVTVARTATLNGDTDFSGTWTCSNFAGHDKTINLIAEASHLNITKVVYTDDSGVVTNYERKNVNLSAFDFSGGGSYSAPTATLTLGSKKWDKLDLASYFSGISGTITDVNMKFTENVGSGGRVILGVFGSDGTTDTPSNDGVGNSITKWGLTGSSSANKIYYGTTNLGSNLTIGTATDIYINMNLTAKKFSFIQGTTTKVNNQDFVTTTISLPRYFAAYSWSTGNTTTISDMSMEIVYIEASYYTATFTNTTSGNTPTVTIYTNSGRTSEISNGLLENGETYYFTAVEEGYQDYNGSFTVSGADPAVNFAMTAKTVYNYTVNAVDGEDHIIKANIASGSCYANEEKSFYIPACVYVGGKLYFTTNENYKKTETISSNDQVITYQYTTNTVDNVVFFVEGEDVSGAAESTPSANQHLTSMGHMGRGSDLVVTNLPTGAYTIYVKYCNYNGSAQNLLVKAGDTNLINEEVSARATKSADFSLLTSTDITLTATASSISGVDYIYIVRTGDATVPATLNSAGLASFSSAYPLNLDNITGATAYYAKSDGLSAGKVTLTEATGSVAAGEGLILKGANGADVTIPVAATGTAISGNLMVGCPTAQDITASTEDYANIYVLGASDAQLHNVATYVASNTLSIPAGKAYLKASLPSGARSLTISFDDDDVTGVNEVRSQKEDVRSEWFDLQGRKVAQPQKGLYIVNGKKVVLK